MAINFPNSPTDGQTVVLANKTLVWSSATGTWNVQSSASSGGGSLSISDTVPSSPSDGDMWFNSTSLNLYAYYDDGNSQQWIELSSNDAQMGATVSDTAPSSPANGDFWFDSSTLTWYTYYDDGDSQQWLDLAGQATTVQVTASDTAPTSPSTGQLWFDTANLNLFVYYSDGSSNQWVQMNSEATAVPTDVSDLTDTTGLLGGGVTAYANLAAFPSTGNTEGDFSFAQDTKALYIWNGTEWKRVSIGVDESPIITTEPPTTHLLMSDGSTSTVTMVATDPEGFAITYGIAYPTVNNALPDQLTAATSINQSTGVFTFTPSTDTANIGTAKVRLSASDGISTTTRFVELNLTLIQGWMIGSTSYDNVSYSVAAEEIHPNGIDLSPDGTVMLITGILGDDIEYYTLSTAFDVSTASHSGTISPGFVKPRGIRFGDSGNKIFVCDSYTYEIYSVPLSTAYDVSTAGTKTGSGTVGSISSNANTSCFGLAFKTDGTKMYVCHNAAVYEYSLSTAWDITTLSYTTSFSTTNEDVTILEVDFSADGTKMFTLGANQANTAVRGFIYQYDLSIAWDISSASYSNISFLTSSQDIYGEGMCFGDYGKTMYFVGTETDTVHQYSTEA